MNARVVVATHNAKKLRELERILSEMVPGGAEGLLVSAADMDLPDVVEDGVTFAANALIKARAACQGANMPAVADDSGIAVDVLGGAPGIFSARWAGKHGDDAANRDLLLAQVSDINAPHRRARFVCAEALVLPDGREFVEIGEMTGRLAREARGEGGFGYDPIFVPDDQDFRQGPKTAAEMSAAEKDAISHRSRALRLLAPQIVAALSE
ncbi:RdgB/HAM1 family non-canonical purine NTP pyrophosphatase [Dermabacteraceae bacterium P9123]